ncbi:MAG: hypothetical protein J07HQX50_02049 [Haloquadratum sp. J07HQX50]|nr:MAG: hypothetical protein J07HQX50_02049 [Haloquadratum sp. J07HQX50]
MFTCFFASKSRDVGVILLNDIFLTITMALLFTYNSNSKQIEHIRPSGTSEVQGYVYPLSVY